MLAHRTLTSARMRAFLHVAVAGAEIAQDRAQLAQIGAGFLGRADIGLADDLHQRHAATVEIDVGLRRILIVQRLAGILLQMQPRDADRLASLPSASSISILPAPTIGCSNWLI